MSIIPIYFYSKTKSYFEFSNFSEHPVEIDGKVYPTNEHYFQAAKFFNALPEYAEEIRLARTPRDAKRMGSDRSKPIAGSWNKDRIEVMVKAVRAKFTQHEDLKELLLNTGERILYEDSPSDFFWGVGRTKQGANMLGKILMEVRSELRRNIE